MNWITIIWSMVTSTCLTLAVMHLLVWCMNRKAWSNLLFSLSAMATAALSGTELWMMRAQTPGQFATALRCAQVPVWIITMALIGFVLVRLRAGRYWLIWTACALRTFALLLNFLMEPNLYYRQITSLRHISLLGESITIAEGVSNPWMLVAQLGTLMFIVFLVDAVITVWRRDDGRQALVEAGSLLFFVLPSIVQAVLVLWHIIDFPLMFSVFFIGFVLVMGYELSIESLRAWRLSEEIRRIREEYTHIARVSMMGELTASLSHELKQPLAAIRSNAQAALRILTGDKPDFDELHEILKDVIIDNRRADDVIKKLRTLMRKSELHITALNIKELIEDILPLVTSHEAMRKISLSLELDETIPPVAGDRIQIQQVILNLILNSTEVLMNIKKPSRSITVRAYPQDSRMVMLSVSDNGPGIETEAMPHLFEAFYTTKPEGLGMGLTICRSIVEAHGGRLWAQNNPDGGAAFYFTIPIAREN